MGIVLRMQPRCQATLTQPLQCVLQHHVANPHVSTHMATPDDNNHVAIPLRSATTDSKTPYNYARASTPKAAWSHRYSAAKKGKPTAAATAAHRRYLSTPAAATWHGKTQVFVLRLPPQHKPHATFMQPLQCVSQHHVANLHVVYAHGNTRWHISMRSATTDSKTPYNYARTSTPPKAAWSHRYNAAKEKGKPTAAATAAHRRYLSSPAAATWHGKTQVFVLRLPPQRKPHATFMQPLQRVSQHHVANLHVSTHMATPDDTNHAAISMRPATTDSKTPYNYARTCTPKAAWSHRYNAAKEKGKPTAAATAAHRRFHRRLQPLDTEKHKFLCSGFLPNANPMQPSQCVSQHHVANLHVSIYTYGNTRWQQSCSHSTAICNHKFQNTL